MIQLNSIETIEGAGTARPAPAARLPLAPAPDPAPAAPATPALGPHEVRLPAEAASDAAACRLTLDGVVSRWDRGAERSTGYTAAEAIGLHVSAFYTPEDRANGEPARALAAAREGTFAAYGWRVRRDGSRYWAHVVLEGLRDGAGRLEGFAEVTGDAGVRTAGRDGPVRDLDAALSTLSRGLCLFDADERLVLASPRVWQILGLAEGTLAPGDRFAEFVRAMLRTHAITPRVPAWRLCDRHRALIREPGGGGAVLTFASGLVLSVVHRPAADGSWVTTLDDLSQRRGAPGRVA